LVVHTFLFAYMWLDERVTTYKPLLRCIDLRTWLQVDNIRNLSRAKPLELLSLARLSLPWMVGILMIPYTFK